MITWIKTLIWVCIYSQFWVWLEEQFYGTSQPSVVDSIIIIAFMPMIYFAMDRNNDTKGGNNGDQDKQP